MFENAQKLLSVATYSDIKNIKEEIANMMRIFAENEQKASKLEQLHDLCRCNKYIELKEQKITDKHREVLSKKIAIENYGYIETKSIARIAHKYIELLNGLRMQLMHENNNINL